MPTRTRANGAHALALVAGVALLSLAAAGCAAPRTGAGASGQPPRLHLVTGANTVAGSIPDAAPAAVGAPAGAGAPVPRGVTVFDGYVLVGPLPDQPTQAPVYRWPAGPASVADVRHLAGILGVTATPARHAHGWVVTGTTGELRVRDGGGHQWSYARGDRIDCPPTTVDVDNPDPGFGTGCGVAVSPGAPVPAGPTPADARTAATPLLTALGLAPSEVAAASVYTGYGDATLSVSPTVDGMPTQGLETTVYVDSTGVASLSGRLDRPVPGDVYPLRTAKQAFDELASQPRPLMEPYCGPVPVPSPGTVLPPVTCPSPVPVRITGARLGLLLTEDMTDDRATPLMVPAWFFTTAGGDPGPQVIAIDPSFLAPPVQPRPTTPIEAPGAVSGSGSAGSTGVDTPASAIPPPVPPSRP